MNQRFFILSALLGLTLAVSAATETMRNVRDYGATGDGKTLDTAAIQRAIDAGGIVHFPAGTYLSGTLYLKSNGGLDLAPGALLLASPDRKDYNASDFCPQNRADSPEKNWNEGLKKMTRPMDWVSGAHFIVAVGQHDLVIRGGGTISGNRDAFGPIAVEDPYKRLSTPMPWRPGEMIWICESDRITIENVTLLDAPFWCCVLQACNDISIDNLRISMNPWTRNGDGLTIDACRNVTIANCAIRSADDSIVIKADHRRNKRKQICENIVISNCLLESVCYGIRVGVGNGVMRNVRADNIICRTRIGAYVGLNWGLVKSIENITFSNFTVNCETAIRIAKSDNRLKRPEQDVTIRDITFRNFQGSCVQAIDLGSNVPTRNITVENVDLRLRQIDRSLCPYRNLPKPLSPVIARDIRALTMRNVRIDWEDPYKTFQTPLLIERCSGLTIDNCDFGGRSEWGTAEGFPKPTAEVIKYRNQWKHLY